MYDFYFGDRNQIAEDEEKFLISVKRMLPKWVNSIPDSEFLALKRLANSSRHRPVFVETGLGASTLALLFCAIKTGGVLYSWDTNAEKASQIRTACVETICRYFECDINKHWKVVNALSTSPGAGLGILKELRESVDLFFHDSEHVLKVVLEELDLVSAVMCRPGIICMDDANYSFKYTNTAYINVVRKKLGMPPISDPSDNQSREFYIEVEQFLKQIYSGVRKINDSYKIEFSDDIFFDYFSNEFRVKSDLKMENQENLAHRFDAWEVS